MVRARQSPAPPEHAVLWQDVNFENLGFGVGILHIPGSNPKSGGLRGEAKSRFWDAVLKAAREKESEPYLFIGDFNTGAPGLDEAGDTFYCSGHFLELSRLGWTDMWRFHNPGGREYTWYSNRGNGFRIDHAFATESLRSRISSCRYSHTEREERVSDHSMLIVDVD
jgi:exodeoxyribonuclease-3